MEIDKKIIIKLIQALDELKKSLKDVDIESNNKNVEEEIDLSDKIIVKSPIVGTAYLAAEPGGKKFVLRIVSQLNSVKLLSFLNNV